MIKEIAELAKSAEQVEKKKTFAQSLLTGLNFLISSFLGLYLLHYKFSFFGKNILADVPFTVWLCLHILFALSFIWYISAAWKRRASQVKGD